jgi:Mg/Co/Ni transporter MgtE
MNSDLDFLDFFITHHPELAARILEQLEMGPVSEYIDSLPVQMAAKIINKMDATISRLHLENIGAEKTALLIENIDQDKAVYLLQRSSINFREEVFKHLPEVLVSPIRQKLQFGEGSAGMLADKSIFILQEDYSVEIALQKLRNHRSNITYYIYVVNRDNQLTGILNLRDLMLADNTLPITDIMERNVVTLSSGMNYHAILEHPGWQKYHTLPVTDQSGLFLGAIHYYNLKQIETETKGIPHHRNVIAAGNALGELFQIGLTGLLRSATTRSGFDESSTEIQTDGS